jgi:single-strand DNA-binding protein
MNVVNLIGRTTKDVEMKYFDNQKVRGRFTLALDRYMGKDKEKDTDYIDCECWGSTAETLAEFVRKGKQVGITGNLRQQRWQTDSGESRSKLVVLVDRITFVDGKKEGSNDKPEDKPEGGW